MIGYPANNVTRPAMRSMRTDTFAQPRAENKANELS